MSFSVSVRNRTSPFFGGAPVVFIPRPIPNVARHLRVFCEMSSVTIFRRARNPSAVFQSVISQNPATPWQLRGSVDFNKPEPCYSMATSWVCRFFFWREDFVLTVFHPILVRTNRHLSRYPVCLYLSLCITRNTSNLIQNRRSR